MPGDRLIACHAVIAQLEASRLAKLKAVRHEAEVLATALDLKCCEFCADEFYADELPNWNEEWGGIHCGECCIGECPKCGKEKLKPEGTCEYEHCESDGFVFTCEGCRGSGLCQECEDDKGLHRCHHCDEFYHDDGEPCCKYQRYGNPKFGMVIQKYAEML